jgi:hypothetical protein
MGKPGRAGLRGASGSRGAAGVKGATGLTGKRGAVGATRVPWGGNASAFALTGIHKQIENIYNDLDIQMKRMAQVQAELDEVRAKLQRMTDARTESTRTVMPIPARANKPTSR